MDYSPVNSGAVGVNESFDETNTDNIDLIDPFDENVYFPDFSLKRKKNQHTTRKQKPGMTDFPTETYLVINRGKSDSNDIPITEIDEIIGEKYLSNGTTYINYSNYFERLLDSLEKYCIRKQEKYDIQQNMNKTIYSVPVTDIIFNKGTSNVQNKKITTNQNVHDEIHEGCKERFIIIGDKQYSNKNIYHRISNGFVPVKIPNPSLEVDIFSNKENVSIPDDLMYVRVEKSSFDDKTNTFTFTFPFETSINGINLEPVVSYTTIHTTMFKCTTHGHRKCEKPRHCINVIKNYGFIKKFEIYYRTPSISSKWIFFGKFDGNYSMFSHNLINFDDIIVKEIRIVAIESEGNVNKVSIKPFGKSIAKSIPSDSLQNIEYIIYSPRDGKYCTNFTKRNDFIQHIRCTCGTCTIKRKEKCGKGKNKNQVELNEFINDCFDDFIY
jgi:hypothetical protein